MNSTGPASFGSDRRLPDKAAFDNVFSAPDIRLRRHPFSLLARRSGPGASRLGLVVGKRHARRAVDRNRLRRVLRERFRHTALEGMDIIVLARPGASDVGATALDEAARWLFARVLERSEAVSC